MEKQHKISLLTAILMNINIMDGAGILMGPPLMAQYAGFASFLGWPLVALIFLPIVLSISSIARIFPGAGSFYSYSKNLINPTAGFISGWVFFLGYVGVAALQTFCLRTIVFNQFGIVDTWHNIIAFNVLFFTAISLIAMLRLPVVGRLQNVGTMVKLLPLILVLSLFVFYWNPGFAITTQNLSKLPSIVPVAIFGFWGFEYCCSISHLIEGDSRNASRAILIAFGVTLMIYTTFHFGLLHIMGPENLAMFGTEHVVNFLHLNAKGSLIALLSTFFTFALSIVYVNSILSISIGNAATLQAMASENLLPFSTHLTKENKNCRPLVAIIAQSILATMLTTLTSNKHVFISLINVGILCAFLLTLIALWLLQTRTKQYGRMIITALAFISWTIFFYFSWMQIGATAGARFLALAPLAVALIFGFVGFCYKQSQR